MLGLDRSTARATWTAAIVLLALCLVYLVRKTLFVFIVALLFAYLLSPLVNFLDRILPTSRTRTPALALAYVLFVAFVVFAGFQIGSNITEQATRLSKDFPAMLAKWEQPSPDVSPTINSIKTQIIQRIRNEIQQGSSKALSAIPEAGMKFVAVASELIYVVIVPILAFFFLKDGRVIRQHFIDSIEDGPRRALIDDVLADVHLLLAHYMRALVILSVAAFTAYTIFFFITGVPYAVLLGALGGALEFIPMLGPLTAAILILIVAGVSGAHVLAVLVFLLLYRMFQDYILSPHLMGAGVELHPLLVLFGVFAGAEIAGIPGTFLSVPVIALVRIVYYRMRKSRAAKLAPRPVA